MDTYFCTENYIKELTPITNNVEFSEFEPMVRTQAEMRVQPMLGSHFFNDLLVKYNAQTLSVDETILVQKMQPIIAWSVASETALITSYQIKNKGIQVQSGEYSSPASIQEVREITLDFRQKSEFYENRLRAFLKENKDLFPEFISKLNKDSDLYPKFEQENGGFYSNMIDFI